MAREYAQIKLAVWADDDWRDLSALSRYLYLSILTSPTLSHCGVADWRPARLSAVNGMSTEEIKDCGGELAEALYVVIDEDSEEVLVRSFVRNDGLMKQPKMAVAMASAHAAVASQAIRGVIVHEIKRLRDDFPALSGWGAERATDLLGMRSVDPSDYPTRKGSGKGKRTPFGEGSEKGSPTPTPTPTPTTSNLSPREDHAADAARPPGTSLSLVNDDRPDVAAACAHLAEAIESTGAKRPTVTQKWRTEARLMLDRDGRSATEVAACIRWLFESSHRDAIFWRTNVRSMPKLRAEYDRLLACSQRNATGPTTRATEQQALLDRAMARAEERERGMA